MTYEIQNLITDSPIQEPSKNVPNSAYNYNTIPLTSQKTNKTSALEEGIKIMQKNPLTCRGLH